MKKYLLYIIILFSVSVFSQRTGISYQALILNPNGEQLPGYNNQKSPLINKDICLEFSIVDDRTIDEYIETQSVKTDSYGMVNLIIGTGSFEGGFAGSWDKISWSGKSKKLKVRLDISGSCSSYTEISNQELTSVPFSLYAPGSDLKQTLFKTTLESAGVNCTNGGIKIEAGVDENENNVLDSSEIDSALTKYVCNGAPGEDGEAGKKTLILATAEAAGTNCANGGVKIEIGTDTNGNDTLDTDEIVAALTKYVCNGVSGEQAKKTLILATAEAAGTNCANGGVKIEIGTDTNGNDTLDTDEIVAALTKYVCNGAEGLLSAGSASGNTSYWNGSEWVVDSNLIYNDGTNVMIGTTTTDATSALTVSSSTKGVLIPRLTKAERDAITTPTTSLLIYQSDNTPGYYYYNGTVWKYLTNITPGSSSSTSSSDNLTLIYLNTF